MNSNVSITAGPIPTATVTVTLCGDHDTDVKATKDATKVLLAVLDVSPEDVPLFKARIRDSVLGRLVTPPEDHASPPASNTRASRPKRDESAPTCREHHSAMRRNRADSGWYCPRKSGRSYCDEKVWDED